MCGGTSNGQKSNPNVAWKKNDDDDDDFVVDQIVLLSELNHIKLLT